MSDDDNYSDDEEEDDFEDDFEKDDMDTVFDKTKKVQPPKQAAKKTAIPTKRTKSKPKEKETKKAEVLGDTRGGSRTTRSPLARSRRGGFGKKKKKSAGGASATATMGGMKAWKTQSWGQLYSTDRPRGGAGSKGRTRRSGTRTMRGKTMQRTGRHGDKGRGRGRRVDPERLERLSEARTIPQRTFVKRDDIKNCTFRPKIRVYKSESKAKEADNTTDKKIERFIDRQTASTRAKRAMLKEKRGEEEYKPRQDKKVCRNCGNVQSYDEVMSKKKSCPCNGKYGPANGLNCGKRMQNQIKRAEKLERQRQTRLAALKERVKAERNFDDEITHTVAWEDVSHDFMQRYEGDLATRRNNKAAAMGPDWKNSKSARKEKATVALRSVRSDLVRAEEHMQNLTMRRSGSGVATTRNRSSNGGSAADARMLRLQQQLKAAALMAQQLQTDVDADPRATQGFIRPQKSNSKIRGVHSPSKADAIGRGWR